jgi:hypothetical protein
MKNWLLHYDSNALARLTLHASKWAADNQWAVGLAEMALGAVAIQSSLNAGLIEMGRDVVASASRLNTAAAVAGTAGMSIGSIAGSVIGSIGIAAMGTAVAVPGSILAAGGAAIFGAAGYAITDIVRRYLSSFDLSDFVATGSLFGIGVALLVDGARRSLKDEKVAGGAARLANGVVRLSRIAQPIVASTMNEFHDWSRSLATKPSSAADAVGNLGLTTAAGLGGAAIGSSIAASSVSVLGSYTLGTTALSLGLVSAPVWPLVAGCAGGACAGYMAWKTAKRWIARSS